MLRALPIATLALPLLLLPGCGQGPAAGGGPQAAKGSAPNVILICMDTVRADRLGSYGYTKNPTTPALDALAQRSSVFLDTSATACWTKPSVPSYLTGTYPIQHGAYLGDSKTRLATETDTLPKAAVTLAELYQAAGYQTGAYVRNAQLRRGLGFEQGFDTYVDEAGDAREIRWQASDWLDDRQEEEPFFLYLHFLDAHWPYPVPDEYATRFADPERVARFQAQDWRALRKAINRGEATLEPEDLEALLDLYDGSIRYIDDQLARLFAKLEREGLAEDTIVCVISDHGEEFLEHGKIGHGHGLYEALLQVPFLLHVPGREPARVEAPCSLVDLFPTLAAASGLQPPGGLPGVNLLDRAPTDRVLFSEHLGPRNYQQAWRRNMQKVWREARPGPGFEEAAAALEAEVPTLDPDLAWEVELDVTEDGRLVAREVQPLEDEEPGDELELKGPVDALTPDGLTLCGVPVVLADDTRVYGVLEDDQGRPRMPAPGMLVKAKGELDEQGRLVATKLKLYEPDAGLQRELRGPVTGQTADTLTLGGVQVELDGATRFDLEGYEVDLRFTRQDVLELASLEADEPPSDRFQWEAWTYDLAQDPTEQDRHGTSPDSEERRGMWRYPRLWAERRLWSAEDKAVLSEADLERLRAIGYAE